MKAIYIEMDYDLTVRVMREYPYKEKAFAAIVDIMGDNEEIELEVRGDDYSITVITNETIYKVLFEED